MKKLLSLALAALMLAGMLTGCGERLAGMDRPGETAAPTVTEDPNRILPDPRDGEVRDTDGFIDDNDSGPYTSGTTNGTDGGTANNGTGNTMTGNGTAGTYNGSTTSRNTGNTATGSNAKR